MLTIEKLNQTCKHSIDVHYLRNNQHTIDKADALLHHPSLNLQKTINFASSSQSTLELKFLSKLIESRDYIRQHSRPLKVAIICAMSGEHNTLKLRTSLNTEGENALNVKLDQLSWLFSGTEYNWQLYACDDGCLNQSADVAANVTAEHPHRPRLSILKLQQAIQGGHPAVPHLTHHDQSHKGGAIRYAAQTALDDGADLIITTDLDLSIHLGQVGLLIRDALQRNSDVVLGDRFANASLYVPNKLKQRPGEVLLRHIKRRIGFSLFSSGISDGRSALRCFTAEALTKILSHTKRYDLGYESEWMGAIICYGLSFSMIAYAEVADGKNTHTLEHYCPEERWHMLLHGMIQSMRQFNMPYDTQMADVVEAGFIDQDSIRGVLSKTPPQLRDLTKSQLGKPMIMNSNQVAEWITIAQRTSSIDTEHLQQLEHAV